MTARILIVDDESNIRMMLRLALAHVGYTVETAADGYEGLERFGPDGADWDLVLLDQRMPGLEGLDVLREMRRRQPDARAVMITAFGTFDLAAEAMDAGAVDFLRKPFTVETLRGVVKQALGGPRSVRRDDEASPTPTTLDRANINGFRIASVPGVTHHADGSIQDTFSIREPGGETSEVRVVLPIYVLELIKAHTDREEMPGGTAFYQALCGEALANYLWQHAERPPGNVLAVEDLTGGLRHWIDAVLQRSGAGVVG